MSNIKEGIKNEIPERQPSVLGSWDELSMTWMGPMKGQQPMAQNKDPYNLKDKSVLCYDLGIFTEQCAVLTKKFGKVFYYINWQEAFPKSTKALIGKDVSGMERVLNFWDYVDKVDMIYFPDTHCGDLVEYLKSHGYAVAGVGNAEKLELDRVYGRQIQKQVGLPTQETKVIRGLDNLRKHLETVKMKYVKMNVFRGDIETFRHLDFESSLPLLDYLANEFGPKQNEITFVVEDMIDSKVECGIDSIVFDGETLSPTMYGYEIGGGYIGRIVKDFNEVPEPIRLINEKLAPIFESYKTRFFFSSEVMVDKKDEGYLIDYTCRTAAPGVGAVQTELIENFPEVIWGLATGQKILPVMKYKYAGAFTMDSPWADRHWVKVSFPPELRRWIKFRTAAKFGEDYYTVPGIDDNVCSVIALGNSIEEVADTLIDRAEKVKAYSIGKDYTDIANILEEIEKGRHKGIPF